MSSERERVRDILGRAVAEFEGNGLCRRVIRQCEQEAPQLFMEEGLNILVNNNDSAGHRFLASLLVRTPLIFQELTNRWKFTHVQVVNAAKVLQRIDENFEAKLISLLPGSDDDEARPCALNVESIERTLEILDEISPGRRIVPAIRHLTGHHDSKISARAALLIGKRVQNTSWAKRIITEAADGRLRANATETMWGLRSQEVLHLFRECLKDSDNRVVGNAIIGLHRAGYSETFALVSQIAADSNPKLRMTAAWAMGKIGDTSFISLLSPLVRDTAPEVRRATLRSLKGLHAKRTVCEGAGPLGPSSAITAKNVV